MPEAIQTVVVRKCVLRYIKNAHSLRGLAAILYMSCDACSDSITKLLCAYFIWYHTITARHATNGVLQRCADVKLGAKGGYHTLFGRDHLPEKVLRDMGYHSDITAISRNMGPLRTFGNV